MPLSRVTTKLYCVSAIVDPKRINQRKNNNTLNFHWMTYNSNNTEKIPDTGYIYNPKTWSPSNFNATINRTEIKNSRVANLTNAEAYSRRDVEIRR